MTFKLNSLSLLCVAAFAAPVLATSPVPAAAQQGAVLLNDATLHTVSNGVLENTDLLMVDGKIAAIGKDLSAPAGGTVVELQGKHVYPGLIALANQLGLVEIEAVRATDDTHEVTDTNPDVRAQVAYDAQSDVIPTVRSNGISYSLVFPAGSLLMGQSSLMQLDAWSWQDATVKAGVALHINWPNASVLSSPWNPKKPEELAKQNAEDLQKLYDTMAQAKAYVDAKKAGAIKALDSRWEAMVPVFSGERAVFAHAEDARQIRQAMALADKYQLKLTIVGGRDSWRVADELAARKVPVIFSSPFGIPERDDESVETAYATPAKLAKAGVTFALAIGSYWDSRNLAFGAGQAVAFGLDKEQALAAVTLNAAKIAGVDDKLGSLEVGKAATVVVSEGDILDYRSSKISSMWIDGRAVDLNNKQKDLHQKYQQRYSR